MLDQATALWPRRRTSSDGICSSWLHRLLNRGSDHDYGNAVDLSHDPAAGVDCHVQADRVKDDPRAKYVIWNRRIYNPSVSPAWRRYDGTNPHETHMHVSIYAHARNDTRPWFAPHQEDDLTPDQSRKLDELHAVLVQGKTSKTKGALLGEINHQITQDETGGTLAYRVKRLVAALKK